MSLISQLTHYFLLQLKVLGMAMIMEGQFNDYREELLLGTCQGTKNVLQLYRNMVNLEVTVLGKVHQFV